MGNRLKGIACGIGNDIIQWWRGVTFVGVICFALGAIVSGPLSNFGVWVGHVAYARMFPPPTPQPTPNTISFNAVGGCFAGNLSRTAKVYMPDGIILDNGADNLTICDPQKLTATEADMPKALADKVPGCLSFDSKEHGSLSLIRNSPAVCQIPNTSKIVCDAAHARESFPKASTSYKGDVAPCSDALQVILGFKS